MEERWAPLVYGRTYKVDYNLLVIPEDFSTEDIDWARQHINVTLRHADELKNNPRWSLFKNERYFVIGVSCIVAEIDTSDDFFQKIAKDNKERPLYIFSGYVARVDSLPINDIPAYKKEYIYLFKKPCENIEQLWDKRDYELRNSLRLEYNLEITAGVEVEKIKMDSKMIALDFVLETHRTYLFVWKDSEENRQNIWLNACISTQGPRNDFLNLCLGLSTYKDARQGPFLNVTALEIDGYELKRFRKNLGQGNYKKHFPSRIVASIDFPMEEQGSASERKTENQETSQKDIGTMGHSLEEKGFTKVSYRRPNAQKAIQNQEKINYNVGNKNKGKKAIIRVTLKLFLKRYIYVGLGLFIGCAIFIFKQHFFRGVTVGYFSVLMISFLLLLVVSWEEE